MKAYDKHQDLLSATRISRFVLDILEKQEQLSDFILKTRIDVLRWIPTISKYASFKSHYEFEIRQIKCPCLL
jgi:hypothetical protein